ncbi:MAG: ABC transporter substrate-binding protein [Deltaproteobacteria bacterium]|nr:ABC transporter substrate-binding protein [Deltaproteobacteria bacterium]MDZ4346968.1 ABC transporter substrate-binding protein [Candidatus Binatia bacterium]
METRNAIRSSSTCRSLVVVLLAAVAMFVAPNQTFAQPIKIGRTTGGSGFHIPSYVAMDKGILKQEGLDAVFVAATGGVLVRAAIAKEIDFVPIPGGGSQAMLIGAPLVFIVGQSLISQWTLTTTPDIKRVEDLRGKTLGLGRPGSADYEELVVTLAQHFKMQPGRDYKVIAFTGEPDRIAALLNGSIQGGAVTFPHAARAEKEGMKILFKTGDYIPRLGGSMLTHKDNVRDKRDMMKRFIRAMAKADDYVRTNKKGTMEVIQKYFEIDDPAVVEGIYKQVANAYSPDLPRDLIKALFESRTTPELGWPKGKPLPDLEQFVARDLLNEVLKEMGRKPSK